MNFDILYIKLKLLVWILPLGTTQFAPSSSYGDTILMFGKTFFCWGGELAPFQYLVPLITRHSGRHLCMVKMYIFPIKDSLLCQAKKVWKKSKKLTFISHQKNVHIIKINIIQQKIIHASINIYYYLNIIWIINVIYFREMTLY